MVDRPAGFSAEWYAIFQIKAVSGLAGKGNAARENKSESAA